MKTRHISWLILPLAFSLASCGSAKTKVDVIIMGGQSNMVGCSTASTLTSTMGSASYNEYLSGYKGIKIAYDCWTRNGENDYLEQNGSNGKFVTTLLGEGNSDLTFGPEIGMAETFSKTRNDKVFLIKYACGSSSLLNDWAAPSSGKRTTMYANFLAYVKKEIKVLQDSGYDPTIRAMCWMQGEADSFTGYCEEYYQQLHYFAKDLRSSLAEYSGGVDFAFVDGGVSNSAEWPKYQIVNAAKQQFASESDRNVYIDTLAAGLDKSKLQADNAHYISSAMVSLGRLFAENVEPFLSKLSS